MKGGGTPVGTRLGVNVDRSPAKAGSRVRRHHHLGHTVPPTAPLFLQTMADEANIPSLRRPKPRRRNQACRGRAVTRASRSSASASASARANRSAGFGRCRSALARCAGCVVDGRESTRESRLLEGAARSAADSTGPATSLDGGQAARGDKDFGQVSTEILALSALADGKEVRNHHSAPCARSQL